MTSQLANRSARGMLAPSESQPVGGDLVELNVNSVSGMFNPEESQAYFWTEEWQRGEREADEDIEAGRVTSFDNIDDALRWLRDSE